MIRTNADPAFAQVRHFHAASRDEPSPCRHREAAQGAPFCEGIDDDGGGLGALPGAALLFCFEPSGSLLFGFGSSSALSRHDEAPDGGLAISKSKRRASLYRLSGALHSEVIDRQVIG